MKPKEWKLTASMMRFTVMLILLVTCADDGGFMSTIFRKNGVLKRIFANQGARCRQFFAVPRTRWWSRASCTT